MDSKKIKLELSENIWSPPWEGHWALTPRPLGSGIILACPGKGTQEKLPSCSELGSSSER